MSSKEFLDIIFKLLYYILHKNFAAPLGGEVGEDSIERQATSQAHIHT